VPVSAAPPVRGKEPKPGLGTYSRTLADGDVAWAGDYLHTNGYLPGLRLQTVLNRNRRRRQAPTQEGRGGLSRREWRRGQAAGDARRA